MRILFVSQWFDPEPTPKALSFVKALVALGHEVEVITGFPNYPGGKLYGGYRLKGYQKQRMDGVTVHRLYLFPSHDQSGVKRAINYLSFMVSSFLFITFAARKADVMYCYHPPLTAGFSVSLAGWLRRIPFVYDIQDLWPDTLEATGMVRSRRVIRLVDWLCSFVYQRASRIAVLSDGFRKRLVERGVPDEKIQVIYNWCDEAMLGSWKGSAPAVMAGKFNIVFAGTMGRAQALESVLAAASIVRMYREDIQFVFVGGGVCLDELKAKAAGIANVVFLPRMPMNEVGCILDAADVLLIHLRDEPLFSITIPSKTQAYMAAGKPVIVAVRGESALVVEAAGAGFSAQPESPQSLARLVLKMAGMSKAELLSMGQKGRDFYFSTMSLSKGAQLFSRIFEEAVSNG